MTEPARVTAAKGSFWSHLLNTRILICIFTGFASGLPLYILIQLLPAWFRTEGLDLKTIGLFSAMTLPYALKFLWSPVVDRYAILWIGRRRGWMLLTQTVLMFAIAALGLFSPTESLYVIAVLVFVIVFFSATQDITIDAYRREILPDAELGIGNSFAVNAYRLSSLVPGSLALILADHVPWWQVHLTVASFMLVGIVTTLIVDEPRNSVAAPKTIMEAVVDPFVEFFTRDTVGKALLILAFLFLYKLGDNMAVALATPFYLDIGFTKTEIGTVAKIAALWSSIAGGIIGGILMIKMGINRALWVFGGVQMMSITGFIYLSIKGPDTFTLFWVQSFEYLGVGLGTVALVAFMARLSNMQFTATQFALLSSLSTLPRVAATSTTGFIIEAVGYTNFFIICTVMAIPGLLLLAKIAPWNGDQVEDDEPATPDST